MCFSWAWFQQLLIWMVIVGAIIAILKVLLPYVLRQLPAQFAEAVGVLSQIVNIVIWAVIIIFVIYVVFALIACLWSMGGGGVPLFPRGR